MILPRLLVTGAGGLLGANVVLQALGRCDVVAHTYGMGLLPQGFEVIESDLVEDGAVERLLREVRPDWVIHCAALAEVDRCEKDPELARRVNAELAGRAARAAAASSARFLHISTDAVFDGQRGGYTEADAPRPVNRYGESKLTGEQAVLAAHPGHLVVRTNFFTWPAPGRQGLAGWILQRLGDGLDVPGFADVSFSPILASLLAGILLDMLAARLGGLYHAAGRTCLSKYDFAVALAQAMGLDTGCVVRSASQDAQLVARRGGRLCLDVKKVESALGRPMPSLDESLHYFRGEQRNGYVDALQVIRRPPSVTLAGRESS
jgi:dTDP-4-dehydrorhamnose reductase